MITGLSLLAVFTALGILGALFGQDTRDRRWSATSSPVVHPLEDRRDPPRSATATLPPAGPTS